MRLIIIIGLVLVISLNGGCTPVWGFDSHLSSIVKPYRFSIASWELKTLLDRSSQSSSEEAVEDEPSQVTKYFSLVERINALKSEIKAIDSGDRSGDSTSLKTELSVLEGQRANLEDAVRRIITNQIREVLAEQGIFNPVYPSIS